MSETTTKRRSNAVAKTIETDNGPARRILPTEHVKHDAVFVNELRARHFGFKTGRIALEQELNGRRIKLDEEIAALQRDFASVETQLQGQIADMQAGEDRALRALGKDGLGEQDAAEQAE